MVDQKPRTGFPFLEGLGYIGATLFLFGAFGLIYANSTPTYDMSGNMVAGSGLTWGARAGLDLLLAAAALFLAFSFWRRAGSSVRNRTIGASISVGAISLGIAVFELLNGAGTFTNTSGTTNGDISAGLSPFGAFSGVQWRAVVALTLVVIVAAVGLRIVRSGLLSFVLIYGVIIDAAAIGGSSQSGPVAAGLIILAGIVLLAVSTFPVLRHYDPSERRWDDASEFLRLVAVIFVGTGVAALSGSATAFVGVILGVAALLAGTRPQLLSRGIAAGGAVVVVADLSVGISQTMTSSTGAPLTFLVIGGATLVGAIVIAWQATKAAAPPAPPAEAISL